jgi:CRISPR-associated endonuclease/helicase Cas3
VDERGGMISFAAFLRGLDRPPPYPWQEAFAERCAAGELPSGVAVPTGAGKTTVVEALVWALAMQADRPAAERSVGVRTVWAIDRRILVDEVHARARELASRLAAAVDDPAHALHPAAVRLAQLGGGPPLIATRWRGGVDDPRELLGPLQPQVITSTVAQIGSRLLFRGYGVASGSLPLEAGLAACDTTICLDEAHLAEPLRRTTETIAELRAAAPAAPDLPPVRMIAVTATPSARGGDVVRLGDADRVALGPRLAGAKTARLADAGPSAGDRERIALLVERTLAHVEAGADSTACIVNTVRRARAVWAALNGRLPDGVALALLIGPQRPVDRDELLRAHRGKLFDREDEGERLVCVTTQTFEVGLDADVEAMVSESASMQALVQRLGRLNRSGLRTGTATIVRDPEPWLYGEHERLAWEWLTRHADGGVLDVSVAALEAAAERDDWPQPVRVAVSRLTPEVVAQLAQTQPRPGAWQEPDVDLYLSGLDEPPAADVTVCWRADLRPEQVGPEADAYRELLLQAAPPRPPEQITLSVPAARALIAARSARDGARTAAARVAQDDVDVEVRPPAANVPEAVSPDSERVPFVVIRRGEVRRGTHAAERDANMVRLRDVEPGDVVVLPTDAGGCDGFGLNPAGLGPASDVAGDVRPHEERAAPVRLTPDALREALDGAWSADLWGEVVRRCEKADAALSSERRGAARRRRAGELVRDLVQVMHPAEHPGLARLLAALDVGDVAVTLETIGDRVELPEPEPDEEDAEATSERTDEDERVAALGKQDRAEQHEPDRDLRSWVLAPVAVARHDEQERSSGETLAPPTLADHADAVSRRLDAELERLRLPTVVRASLLLAARAHDHGKADPRFQAFLRRGVRPLGAEPIAKSEFGTRDQAASRRAAQLAGLPSGLAHEGASVAIVEQALASGDVAVGHTTVDDDLVVVAVGTHHGRARPLPRLPRANPTSSPPASFHADVAGVSGTARGDGVEAFGGGAWLRRLTAAQARYGTWGLAYLVGLLVLADRAVSAEGR